MVSGGSYRHARRTSRVTHVLPALAFRLLIPAGFMPGVGEGLTITMQMCHGDGRSAELIRILGQEPPPADRGAAHDAPCMFAATGAAAPLPVPADVLAHFAPVALPGVPRVAPAPLLAPRRTQSPRAPPSMI